MTIVVSFHHGIGGSSVHDKMYDQLLKQLCKPIHIYI